MFHQLPDKVVLNVFCPIKSIRVKNQLHIAKANPRSPPAHTTALTNKLSLDYADINDAINNNLAHKEQQAINKVKGGWGGGGGFRPIILETLILRYGLKGKGRTRPDLFMVALGPCAQFYSCEASEQNGAKHQNINLKRYRFDLDTIRFVS